MFWTASDNPPIAGRLFGLPRLFVVILWIGLLIATVWTVDGCDRRDTPRESFVVLIIHNGETWEVLPAGRGIPPHPLLPLGDTSDAIRCTITLESQRVLSAMRGGSMTLFYRCTANLAVEPHGERYTPEFCESVVDALRPHIGAIAAEQWPGRSLASTIRSAGQPRIIFLWSSLGAAVLFYGGIFVLICIAIDGDRETRSGRWYSCRPPL